MHERIACMIGNLHYHSKKYTFGIDLMFPQAHYHPRFSSHLQTNPGPYLSEDEGAQAILKAREEAAKAEAKTEL